MVAPLVEDALDDIQDAAFGLLGWDDALQSVTEALGARSCVLLPLDQDLSVKRRLQLESKSHARFTSIWLKHVDEAPDPHTTRPIQVSRDRFPTVIEHQITTEDERGILPYYRLTAAFGDRPWWACLRFSTAHRDWALPLYRTERQGPYTETEARNIDQLIPAIRRTIGFAEAVVEAAISERLTSLADFGRPCFLLDAQGRVLRCNEEAERLIGPELWLYRGRLVSDDGTASRTLKRICEMPLGQCTAQGASTILRREGLPWLLAQTMRLSSLSREVFSGARRLLLLRPFAVAGRIDVELLKLGFGLTPTEARLASELTNGPGLSAGCKALGISRETGRTHLRAIFRKTNTSSQAELAALLNRLPKGLPPNDN